MLSPDLPKIGVKWRGYFSFTTLPPQYKASNSQLLYFSFLQDICEDISDHVEQIHALLETEFSLKLLSYSVNVIVDIHAVQLLWHQLRVSVLVLRERILQGLQDANGNYTRQTDILQAFSEETTEVGIFLNLANVLLSVSFWQCFSSVRWARRSL